MNRIIYILSVLLLVCVAFISCEHEDVARLDDLGGGRPIEFIVESEWPEMTKAATSIESFKVWGDWTKDPNDLSNTAGIKESVFGVAGARVNKYGNTWALTQEADWHQGYYNFAAVYPSTLSGYQAATFGKVVVDEQNVHKYTDLLTLDLGDEGLNLSSTQTDLMYAFSCINNAGNDASAVSLMFKHAFARVTVKLAYTESEPTVNNFIIYGIHSKINGELKFRYEQMGYGEDAVWTSIDNISELLSAEEVSTEEAPYYTGSSFTSADDEIVLANNLLVFPEAFSKSCYLGIKMNVTIDGQTKDVYANVTSGEWVSGGSYVYTLDADSIEM